MFVRRCRVADVAADDMLAGRGCSRRPVGRGQGGFSVLGLPRHRRLSDARRGHRRRRPGPFRRSHRPGSRLCDACQKCRQRIGPATTAIAVTATAADIR